MEAFANYRSNTTNNASAAIQKQLEYQKQINSTGVVNQVASKLKFQSEYGAATIAAAQRLSEQHGIPTFDISGNVSTVPTTRPLDLNANVGVGAFTGLTVQGFNTQLANLINAVKSTGGQIANTVFTAPTSTNPTNQSPSGGQQGAADPSNTQPPSGSSSLSQDFRKSLDGIKNYVGPAGLLVGAGLLGLLIISRKR